MNLPAWPPRSTSNGVSGSRPWRCGWGARARAGVACASRASYGSSAYVWVRRRSAPFSEGRGWGRLQGETDRPGTSSCTPRRMASWRATSLQRKQRNKRGSLLTRRRRAGSTLSDRRVLRSLHARRCCPCSGRLPRSVASRGGRSITDPHHHDDGARSIRFHPCDRDSLRVKQRSPRLDHRVYATRVRRGRRGRQTTASRASPSAPSPRGPILPRSYLHPCRQPPATRFEGRMAEHRERPHPNTSARVHPSVRGAHQYLRRRRPGTRLLHVAARPRDSTPIHWWHGAHATPRDRTPADRKHGRPRQRR
jgi:hypothetical protein